MRLSLLTLVVLLLMAGTAQAQNELDQAADGLTLEPRLRRPRRGAWPSATTRRSGCATKITGADAGPIYIAVLEAVRPARPAVTRPPRCARSLRELDRPGTYAGVIGNEFRAGAAGGEVSGDVAGELAAQALEAEKDKGTAAVLNDFVDRVDQAQASNGSNGGGDSGGGFPTFLVVLAGGAAALFGVSALRRRRRERERRAHELEQVGAAAREDLVALGEDIRALDLDVEMPGVDEEAKQHYNLAVERYQQASEALDRAGRAEDVEGVTSFLEEGRWAMVAAKARLAGEAVPERRPPCFFDPRHGPSVRDMEWAPSDGEPRPVPVCAADAARLEDGQEPDMREVEVDGQRMPYWNAGPAFTPWAGGFYGSGLLPGLFVGSLLGGAWFDGPDTASAADQGDFGDFGGGGFGGFGGGDFGGGGDF